MRTAGLLVIGNEILSGKVVDTNSPYLAKELRELGVDLLRILTIPDEVDLIARETRAMSDAFDYVFTSGGIGPTHDDLTMESVAMAFGRRLVLNESMCERIARNQTEPLNESQRKNGDASRRCEGSRCRRPVVPDRHSGKRACVPGHPAAI